MTNKKLYIAEGTLTVKAKGYWFTSGGEKGSFGYYPHLKDKDDYPIFPDTQLHGDLRMAAGWLCGLNSSDKGIIKSLFGSEPRDDYKNASSCLFITDLELSAESKEEWDFKRLEIKPRIEIDDEKRIVAEHMLVNLEMSYLEGLELEAKVYLGYFDNEDELKAAKDLINEAAVMLSGFGAYRSRGYGRGVVSIAWNTDHIFDYSGFASPASADNFTYVLTATTNFRNKQIDHGSTQLLVSRPYITAEQLRGWFAKTYNKIFDAWPDMDEISSIAFPALYPSLCNKGSILLGYPPATSTIKTEKGEVKDMAGRTEIKEEDEEGEEAFFETKTKPLPAGSFVTDEGAPHVLSVHVKKRTRNSIDEKFSTLKEGGLFVQELIGKGTHFGGIIKIRNRQSDFATKACLVLQNIRPIINGCLFEAKIYAAREQATSGNFSVVVEPIPYSQELINYKGCKYAQQDGNGDKKRIVRKDANQVALTTVRAFNTTLKRPRRPRISIAAGSVICGSNSGNDKLLIGRGFGKGFVIDKRDRRAEPKLKEPDVKKPDYFPDLLKDMTRAQAGIVREFLNTKRNMEEIRGVLEDRIAKYDKKGKKGQKGLFEDIKSHFEKDKTGKEMPKFVNFILDELHKAWWDKDNKK